PTLVAAIEPLPLLPRPPPPPPLHSSPTRRSSDLPQILGRRPGEAHARRRPGDDHVARPELAARGDLGDESGDLEDHVLRPRVLLDRKSTRLNSSHVSISYAVFCLKKKKNMSIKLL